MTFSLERRQDQHLTDAWADFVRVGIEIVHCSVAHNGVRDAAVLCTLLKAEETENVRVQVFLGAVETLIQLGGSGNPNTARWQWKP